MMTMANFADMLTRCDAGDGRVVVDMTGLAGHYEVALDIPIAKMGGIAGTSVPNPNVQESRPAEIASDPGGGSVLRSLRSLGLNLEDRKMLVEQLIIDHAEKVPTEN